jgi:peroxiredoxin Q/BCP
MAQLRQEHDQFVARDAVILVAAPDKPEALRKYWAEHRLPFTCLADPEHVVLKRFGQEVKIFKLGRMPAQVLVDKQGVARFVHYGHSMQDIPPNAEILGLLDQLQESGGPGARSD